MQRSTVLFLLVGCTVAAVVAIIAFSGKDDPVAPPSPGSNSPGSNSPGSNGHIGRGHGPDAGNGDTGAGHRGPDVPVAPDAPHVRITVTSRETYIAPPESQQLAVTADGTPLMAEVLAGVGAGFDAEPNRGGVALLAVEVDGRRLLRQVAVRANARSETRIGARVVLRGRVLDVAQQPVSGATVWLGELLADGSERSFSVDAEGSFEADVPAGQGVPLLVRARGYASSWRTIEVDPTSAALTEVLRPATRLSVQLAARAEGLQSVRVFVVPLAPVSTGVSQWPFFRQCLSGGYAVDDQGHLLIEDLPQHGTVGIVVRHPLAPGGRAVAAKLTEQLVQVTVPVEFAASRQLGVVTDPDGNAIAASLWVRSPNQRLQGAPSLRLLPPHLGVRGVCFTQADASGQFEIGLLDEKDVMLSVRAKGYAGRDVVAAAFQNRAVVLPEWLPGEASLRILPPVAGIAWRVSINLGDGITEDCAADEPFVVALPHAGRFDVAMVVEGDGQPRDQRDAKDLMVTGPTDLVTSAPK
tara:strand:- start:2092 stop:3666 length:1575 start_codon:yes stop_codon:yes gene_type:complete